MPKNALQPVPRVGDPRPRQPGRPRQRLRESPGRLRYLEHEEESKLLAAALEPLRALILVGIYAGLRVLSEALTLRWADVDLKRGLLPSRRLREVREDADGAAHRIPSRRAHHAP